MFSFKMAHKQDFSQRTPAKVWSDLKQQEILSLVINSFILMTYMFDQEMILLREIEACHYWGLTG